MQPACSHAVTRQPGQDEHRVDDSSDQREVEEDGLEHAFEVEHQEYENEIEEATAVVEEEEEEEEDDDPDSEEVSAGEEYVYRYEYRERYEATSSSSSPHLPPSGAATATSSSRVASQTFCSPHLPALVQQSKSPRNRSDRKSSSEIRKPSPSALHRARRHPRSSSEIRRVGASARHTSGRCATMPNSAQSAALFPVRTPPTSPSVADRGSEEIYETVVIESPHTSPAPRRAPLQSPAPDSTTGDDEIYEDVLIPAGKPPLSNQPPAAMNGKQFFSQSTVDMEEEIYEDVVICATPFSKLGGLSGQGMEDEVYSDVLVQPMAKLRPELCRPLKKKKKKKKKRKKVKAVHS